MDLKNLKKTIRRIKRISLVSLVMLCSLLMILEISPVKVNAAIYSISDFYQTAVVDGSDKTAFYEIDVPAFSTVTGGGSEFASGYGTISFTFPAAVTSVAVLNVYHFGSKLFGNSSAASDGLLDVSDIMSGAVVSLDLDFEINMGTATSIPMSANFNYTTSIMSYDKNMKRIATYSLDTVNSSLAPEGHVTVDNSCLYTLPSNAAYIGCFTQIYFSAGFDLSTMSAEVAPKPVIISVDTNMIYEQSQTMQKIEQQLQDTNDKLDDIWTGGQAGENLGSAGDSLASGNNQASGSMDNVDQFEGGLMLDAQDKLDDLDQLHIGAGVGDFAGSITFVSGYLTSIFTGVEQWGIVVTLSMFLGIVFYICQYSGGASRLVRSARASGDASALAARRENEMRDHLGG